MSLRRIGATLSIILTLQLSNSLTSVSAQTARDTLTLGRRAYERVDFPTAVRLLPVGLTAGGSAGDTLWIGAVHMLTDALLDQGQDSLAQLWARWASRLVPDFAIDSQVYPPRVSRTLAGARTATGAAAADTMVNTAWDATGDSAAVRGMLRIQRGGPNVLAVVEGIGTMLPGESRSAAPGTYTIRLSADGYLPLTIAREVLPGYSTVLTPRLARPGTPAATVAASPPGTGATAAGPAPATNAPVIRGATLAASGGHACAVLDGSAVCWGNNAAGQLGSGVADSLVHNPVTVRFEASFAVVSAGPTHTCALNRDGRAWCWGLGTNGELGSGQATSSATPVLVLGSQVFTQIAAGGAHTCALNTTGAAFCWGSNRSGALGNRTGVASAVPAAVAAPPGVSFTALVSGNGHNCALASNGSVYCWGLNNGGQVGNGTTVDAGTPVLVQSPVPFKAVAAGGMHSCALTPGGAAWCWGANGAGQLGSGIPTADSPRPTPVTGALTLAVLVAGESHSCGLTEDGAAYCWGAGRASQLGNGQSTDSPRPVLVVGGHVFRSLALGTAHSCAATDDRTTWCWGVNGDGQLGSLAGRSTATPVPVLLRPAPRQPPTAGSAGAAAPLVALRETFSDGNWTAGPAWSADSAIGLRIAVSDSALSVARSTQRGQAVAGGVTVPVRIPVTRTTQIQFDVMLTAGGMPCGLNCANYPALVRLRVQNSDLTESEVWYAFGDRGAQSRSLGSVVIVARGNAPVGQWLREQRFTVRDALPRAEAILQVSLGGVGSDLGARFDNVLLPVPVATTMDVAPDSIRLTAAAATQRLRAAVRDAAGEEIPRSRITWTTSDSSIVRADSAGVVTAVRIGRAVVRASSGAVADSAVVTVQSVPRARAPARPARRP